MPSPREIALQKNDKSKFKDPNVGYNAKEGLPNECVPPGKYADRGKGSFKASGSSEKTATKTEEK